MTKVRSPWWSLRLNTRPLGYKSVRESLKSGTEVRDLEQGGRQRGSKAHENDQASEPVLCERLCEGVGDLVVGWTVDQDEDSGGDLLAHKLVLNVDVLQARVVDRVLGEGVAWLIVFEDLYWTVREDPHVREESSQPEYLLRRLRCRNVLGLRRG
ncbi:hypothetical protein BDK51DRAFT_27711 [Blyttiomyces helicus]|uniref:Uncharacterized protein n=1 Tax=Blyttiomyces helicus TaxID=388810 RepID=A0A4P9WRH5_9FUNG|nr:hypothetical protein BDK51DRAFT_27711 [Blyttiomyces helicus]|eukprot:RKO93870.1 hypothetical protein BDK51DRAFT_27711 [Blyttiomyces helicus]